MQGVLPKGYEISQKYKILLFVKHGSNAETYRVKGHDGKLYLLKLFNYSRLNRNAFDSENNLLEIKYLKELRHENILSYHDSGELIYDGKKFGFLVLEFISGETLAERLCRESFATLYDIQQIGIDILNGLDYLHNQPDPIIHNEITPQNIMLDLSSSLPKAILIDSVTLVHFINRQGFIQKRVLILIMSHLSVLIIYFHLNQIYILFVNNLPFPLWITTMV